MKIILATAPVLEPITRAELLTHLRLDSGTFDGNLTLTQSLAYGSKAIANEYTTHVGTGIDVLGKQADVIVHHGTNATNGTVDTRIEESDQLATGYTAWTGGAFTQVTTTNDNADYKLPYTGTKQYIRTASKVLQAACEFGTSILVNSAVTAEDDDLTDLITDGRVVVENILRRALLTQTWDYYLKEFPEDDDFIKLPFGNLASVTSVSWKDTDGVETNLTKTITAFAASGTSPATKTAVTSAAHGFSDGDIVSISGTTSYDGGWEISNVTTNSFDILMVFVADDAAGYASHDYLIEKNGEGIGRIVLPYGESWLSDTLYPSNPIKIRFICGWTTAALVPKSIKRAVRFAAEDAYYHGNRHDVLKTVIMNLLSSYRLWDEF